MKTKIYFAFRVDIWDDTGDSIVEHVAGVDDFEVAEATYRVTLRQGARVGSVQNLSHFRFGWLSTPVSVSRFGLAPRCGGSRLSGMALRWRRMGGILICGRRRLDREHRPDDQFSTAAGRGR